MLRHHPNLSSEPERLDAPPALPPSPVEKRSAVKNQLPPADLFGAEPLDVERLQRDPAYRQAYEDWLDHQENLRRTPQEARRLDWLFLGVTTALTLTVLLLLCWLFWGS